MRKIIVFGSINNDFSINVDKIPSQGETIMGNAFLISPGGKGENQAVAAARLGGDVHLIGHIGDDAFGHQILMSLKREGVKTTFVKLDTDHPTASAFIIRCRGDNRIIVNPGANDYLSSADLQEFIASHDDIEGSVFIAQLEANKEETLKALKIAHQEKMITILNPSPVSSLPFSVFSDVDCLVVNQSECQLLTDIYPNDGKEGFRVYEKLLKLGLKNLIITLGSKGSIVYMNNSCVHIPAYKIEALDSTGAGDTYLGAIGYGISQGWDISKASYFASAASALKCLKIGAQTGMPTLMETLNFMNKQGGIKND